MICSTNLINFCGHISPSELRESATGVINPLDKTTKLNFLINGLLTQLSNMQSRSKMDILILLN